MYLGTNLTSTILSGVIIDIIAYDVIKSTNIRSAILSRLSQIVHLLSKSLNYLRTRRSTNAPGTASNNCTGRTYHRITKMTSFLHLPFELQSQVLGYAFEEALKDDLASQDVQPYSKVLNYNTASPGLPTTTLSPMHLTTNTYMLFANLLSLTFPCEKTASTMDLLSTNQLTYCLNNIRKHIAIDSIGTKALMRDIVLRHPWARITGDTYCTLWRRKERAELVKAVIESALNTLRTLDETRGASI